MPEKLGSINGNNVIFFVDLAAPWRERLRAALLAVTSPGETAQVDAHLNVLERRFAGELDWTRELPPYPHPARAYVEMLKDGGLLPIYRYGPLQFTVDLLNPQNEAEDPSFDPAHLAIELVMPRQEVYPLPQGRMPDGRVIDPSSPSGYGLMAELGAALGELTGCWAEVLKPYFAFADMQYQSRFLNTATNPRSVSHPAPPGTRYWDYLWSLSYWSPELLTPRLSARLQQLTITPQMRARFDRFWSASIRPTWRQLATGGLLVQYRFVFGTEGRADRTAVDTPLAKQAGLRTTKLTYRVRNSEDLPKP